MEEIHESMPGSEQRTFSYVWSIMRKKIANSTEGVNRAAVIASWKKSNTLMLAAKGRKADGAANKAKAKAPTKAQKAVIDGVNAQVAKMNAMIATANKTLAKAAAASKTQPQAPPAKINRTPATQYVNALDIA